MKRIKDLLLSISILCSIIIVILIISSILKIKTTTELSINPALDERYVVLKERVNSLSDGECKDMLLRLADNIEKGRFEGLVKIKDVYDYLWNFNLLEYYTGGKEKCGITDQEMKDNLIPHKFTSNMIFADSIVDKYTFAYELKIHDSLEEVALPKVDALAFNSYRSNQMDILSNYLDIIDLEDTNE